MAGVSVADGLSAAATLQSVMTVDGECRTQRVTLPGGAATWTVLGPGLRVVGPAEEFLEYLRVQGTSPNTVKSMPGRWPCGGRTCRCSAWRGMG